jgi:DNA-binding transcriptional regulator YiaG
MKPKPKPAKQRPLSERLRAWKGDRTAQQCADLLHINRRTLEDWLQNRKHPRGLALHTLNQILNNAKP